MKIFGVVAEGGGSPYVEIVQIEQVMFRQAKSTHRQGITCVKSVNRTPLPLINKRYEAKYGYGARPTGALESTCQKVLFIRSTQFSLLIINYRSRCIMIFDSPCFHCCINRSGSGWKNYFPSKLIFLSKVNLDLRHVAVK